MTTYVLDTYALMAYYLNQKGAQDVKSILYQGVNNQANLAMSVINLGELYFMIYKKVSPERAQILWRRIGLYGIQIYDVTHERTFAAASLKAQYSTAKNQLSYADCFAATLVQELQGTLVTGDDEFKPLANTMSIQFLPR